MAKAMTYEVDEGVVSSPAIKVNKACKFFGEKGDERLAHNLQGEEFEKKYNWNREVRRNARTDVPMARAAYDEEEERQQRERMEFLQNQTKLAEADAELARYYQKEEEMLAREAKERERRRREARDRELAKRFQEMDVTDDCNTRIDEDDVRQQHSSLSSNRSQGSSGQLSYLHAFVGLGDHRLRADDDDLSEEERRQLILLQDQELALALQEHERLKALRAERHRMQEERLLQSGKHQTEQGTTPTYATPMIKGPSQETTTTTKSASEPDESEEVSRRGITHVGFEDSKYSEVVRQQQSSPGPPTRQAPRPGVPDTEYLVPALLKPSGYANGIADKSVTVVTAVGNSAFYKNVGAEKTGSRSSAAGDVSLPRSSRKNTSRK